MRAEGFYRRLADYFGAETFATRGPIVAQTFTPADGWVTWSRYRKTVTLSWVRKLRAQGVTHVQLVAGGRCADFTVAELLRTP